MSENTPSVETPSNVISNIPSPSNSKPESQLQKSSKFILGMVGLIIVCLLVLFGGSYWVISSFHNSNSSSSSNSSNSNTTQQNSGNSEIAKFASEEEFKAYLANLTSSSTGSGSSSGEFLADKSTTSNQATSPSATTGSTTADRYSTTNNQVAGVDEPDIVKTDGKNIYLSSEYSYGYYSSKIRGDVYFPYATIDTPTKIINTLPVDKIGELAKISENGKLLLSSNVLVINVNNQSLVAYDVSDSKNPSKIWKVDLDSKEYISSLRTIDNVVYIISNTGLTTSSPCVYQLYNTTSYIGSNTVSPVQFRCMDLEYPKNFKKLNETVNVGKFDIKTGKLIDKNSFLAQSNWNSLSYISQDNSYLVYQNEVDQLKFLLNFIASDGKNLFPQSVINRLNYLSSLDISSNSINSEIYTAIYAYTQSLSSDDTLKFNNNIQNALTNYIKKIQRDLSSSRIIKVSNSTLQVVGDATVAGSPLNQYSLDEYQGNLRIATTTSTNFYISNFNANSVQTLNDVYIFDKDMKQIGSVLDLGVGERIYSSRFVGPIGYLVTFKQTDPFYVLDLSDPKNPKKTGELKIPGYSSYLHPISDKFILGVGQEGSQLKISLFDISDKSNPVEVDKYTLADYGSSIGYDPHAFLLDSDKKLFFIPGYNGAYIFSYSDAGKLKLAKAVSGNGIARAVFVNSNLYTISSTQIKAIDENNFDVVGVFDVKN